MGPRNQTRVFSSGGKYFLIFFKNCVSRGVTVVISMWVKGPGESRTLILMELELQAAVSREAWNPL